MALAARSRLVGPGVAAFSLAGMLAVSATLVAAAQSTPAQAAPTRPSTAAEDPPNTDYAHKVASLSLHSSWAKSDGYQRTVVESWQDLAKAVGVPEMIVRAIFPWCFTPELYIERPDYIDSLAAFVRSSRCPTSSDSRMPFSLTTWKHISSELPRRRRLRSGATIS
jgi:hypothetical protein